jgi:formylglycine-generating enzyme required for sulfatase activity
MCGNVWEWCWDWLDDHYYTTCNNQGTVINPTGPSNTTELRVERGGCYHENAWVNRIAFRGQSSPLNSGLELGFRVARTP